MPYTDELRELAGVPFDTIWALALGLDAAVQRIAQNNESDSGCGDLPGDLVPLEEFNYTNEKLGCIMRQSMSNLEFTGMTVSLYSWQTLLQQIGNSLL